MPEKSKPKAKKDILVRLDNLGVRGGGAAAWRARHLSFTVARGEIVTLIGPNGSGKSTAAKAAAGLLRPNEGRVERARKLKVGYVPQKLHFDRSLPLNVRRLMTLTEKLPEARLLAALKDVGMAHKIETEAAALSGGELQRVLLARAGARRPDLLILDEPMQGVDFSWENTLYAQISAYRRKLNCGVLLISHDLHIVMAASDRVFCLNTHICCSGKPQDVANSKEYIGLFGSAAQSAPPKALALYRHHHSHRHD